MVQLKGVNFNDEHVKSFKNADDFIKNESPDSKKVWAELFGITDADLKEVYAKATSKTAEVTA